jgi:hypothetical protein
VEIIEIQYIILGLIIALIPMLIMWGIIVLIWRIIGYGKPKYLFNLDIEFETYFKKGKITKEINNQFKKEGIILPLDVHINQEKNLEWNIKLNKNENLEIKKIDNSLTIYQYNPEKLTNVSAFEFIVKLFLIMIGILGLIWLLVFILGLYTG